MKKPVLLLLAGSLASLSFGQNARLVFGSTALGEAYIKFGAAPTTTTYLVINNEATDAITELTAGNGNIISENQNNRIRWRNYATTGAYVVPYTTASDVKIPLTINKTTAGTGAAGHDSLSFVLSTFNHQTVAGAQWDNTLYLPTGVTHMNDFFLGSPDNSMNAVNRFWIIDPKATGWAYTTAPDAQMTFINDDGQDIDVAGATAGVDRDALIPSNLPGPTSLQAQRFNPGLNKWGDYQSDPLGSNYLPATPSAGRSTVNNVLVTNANFYRSWTLSSVDNPLPIELTSWKGECDGGKVELTWTTSTETNNDHFTIEKSATGDTWEEIARVAAAGNTVSETNYSYYDEYANGLAYYRLSQTDTDGRTVMLGTVAAGCDADYTEIFNAWDDGSELQVVVSSTTANVYDVILTDAQGKVMFNHASQAINKGFTPLHLSKAGIATGLYVVTLQNANDVMTRRVFLH